MGGGGPPKHPRKGRGGGVWGLTYHHTAMLQRVLYGGGGVHVEVMIIIILVSTVGISMVKHIYYVSVSE